ncbi:MAG: ATP-binding cassette domain-containing protein [Leptolyngbya sp. SIO4C1]|nr:ATP-binding cassette domain-containing protein [Leptolyngbya sp. SIO4C1]
MISLSQIHVTFNPGTPLAKPALLGLELTIPAGQFVTVIGSNGAGKSTLLNIISGDIQPQRGQIIIDQQPVTDWPAARRAKAVARVFQNPLAGSCAELTIEENLVLALRRGQRRGLRPALNRSLRQRFRDRLASLGLGLESRLRDRMGLLSGGQRQAVSLVMATLAPTKILLLDEHTAALDPKTADYILELTQRLIAEQSLTALMVTHSMSQALALGNRLLMLHAGRIAFDVGGAARSRLQVSDLLDKFAAQKQQVADDSLLLG